MKKDLIVSLGVDGREKYSENIKGLEKSIVDANWEGDVRIYKEWPDWVVPHSVIPYAFKYQIIDRAYKDGYTKIYWLDSCMRLIQHKNIQELLSVGTGIIAFDNLGHPLKNYINDTAIKILEIPNLEGVKQCWGGCIFWDFSKLPVRLFFNILCLNAGLGAFNEDKTNRKDFVAHRHDQAVISWLLHKYNFPLLPYGIIASAKDVTDQTYIQYGD